MMDDLVDLDWSSSPGLAPNAPNKLPTPLQSARLTPTLPSPSTFDLLAKPQNSGPSYYSSTPLRPSTPVASPLVNSNTGNARLAAALPPRLTPVNNGSRTPTISSSNTNNGLTGSGDAFSNLLSLAPGPSVLTPPNEMKALSLAERQAKLAKEKEEKEEREREQFAGDGNFWERFGGNDLSVSGDTIGIGQPLPPPAASPVNLLQPVALAPSRPSSSNGKLSPHSGGSSKLTPTMGSFWNNDQDVLSPSSSRITTKVPTPVATSPAPPLMDPFDFELLAGNVDEIATRNEGGAKGVGAPGTSTSRNGNSGMRTPVSDFDFGDREDGRLNQMEDDDVVPGRIAKSAIVSQKETLKASGGIRSNGKKQTRRSSSPPPHIIGQIVEMGYAPLQARQALAKTSSGQDVEAAIEILLSQPSGREDDEFSEVNDEEMIQRERQRKEEEAEKRRRRRAGPSRDSVKPRVDGPVSADPYAEHKEMILEKAGEIKQWGLSTASSLWNSGKKLLEEQRKALESGELAKGKGRSGGDGRPKWATADGAVEETRNGWRAETRGESGFRDDDHDETARIRAGPSRSNGPRPATARSPEKTSRKTEGRSANRDQADLLFTDDAPSSSVTRDAGVQPTPRPATIQGRPARPPAPLTPLPSRSVVEATTSQLQASSSKKTLGNEHFKLGRFTEAEQAYSSAISALPTGHLFLIPLYNNRAATRLKLGDSSGAAADTSSVIDLVGPAYHPSKEAPLPPETATEVKLSDALVKAIIKRAQAWEMGEKWQLALEDWTKVMSFDGLMLGSSAGSTRKLSTEGARRVRSMLEGGESTKASSNNTTAAARTAKPKPAAVPPRPANTDDSVAVRELRKANQVAEVEDAQRLAVKDSVDSKLNAWKGGKEANLRALIASLDTVLWEEMMQGGMKVGMHELITDKQVKVKYMKVIARLHPDKLNVNDTNVEQRMLANGAFGALNDAWQAFNA